MYENLIEKLLNESSYDAVKIRGEGLTKLWFLVPDGVDLPPIAFRQIKDQFLNGRQVKEENFINDTDESMTLNRWKVWFERQKSKMPGYYVSIHVWDKTKKVFVSLPEVEQSSFSGKDFVLIGYQDMAAKRGNLEHNKQL